MNRLLLPSLVFVLASCGGGTEGFTQATHARLEVTAQNPTLELNYGPASKSRTRLTALVTQAQSGQLYGDLGVGVTWNYETRDDVDVAFFCNDSDRCWEEKDGVKYQIAFESYTHDKLVSARNYIDFGNMGTVSGHATIVATLVDPLNPGVTIASDNSTVISISAGTGFAWKVGTRISGVSSDAYGLKPNNINPMVAYLFGDGGSKPYNNSTNNLIVSIESAPDGTTMTGNTFVDGNSIYQEGQELHLATNFNGEAPFFIQTPSLSGDVRLKIVADRADNDVSDGVQEPVVGYSNYQIADSQNTGTIYFLSDDIESELTVGEEYSSKNNNLILLPVGGDFAQGCSVVSGSLPPGMSLMQLSASFCAIGGTPSVVGSYEFVAGVFSARPNESDTIRVALNVVSEEDFVVLPGRNLGTALVGKVFTQHILIAPKSDSSSDETKGVAPKSVELVDGELPDGLELFANSISGTPTKEGRFEFTLKIVDDASNRTKVLDFYITVLKGGITIVNGSGGTLPQGMVGDGYPAQAFTIKGIDSYMPTEPVEWSIISGKLPDGLEISLDATADTVILSGTPSADGRFMFILAAKDANKASARQIYSIDVCKVVEVTSKKTVTKKDANGNPVPKLDASGNPVLDSSGNPVYETEEVDVTTNTTVCP